MFLIASLLLSRQARADVLNCMHRNVYVEISVYIYVYGCICLHIYFQNCSLDILLLFRLFFHHFFSILNVCY